jgi:cytochrome c553
MKPIPVRLSSFLVFSFIVGLAVQVVAPTAFATEARAKSIYKICAPCHGNNGEGKAELAAPSVAGLPEWYIAAQLKKFRDGVRGKHPKDAAGMRMRPLVRTIPNEDDVATIAKYVSEMKRPDSPRTIFGNVAAGEESYKVCVACHGADGAGNKDLNAPPLRGANDWYLLTQLKNFKGKVRAGNPATDPVGATMAPMAAILDEDAMKNVVTYINALK